MHTCTVCGYNELPEPPVNWMICPCCRTMFGYEMGKHNGGIDIATLRTDWIARGAKWWSKRVPKPDRWNPLYQLEENIGYTPSAEEYKLLRLHPIMEKRMSYGLDLAPIKERCDAVLAPVYAPSANLSKADQNYEWLRIDTSSHYAHKEFIAAARADVLALIAEVERLREELARHSKGYGNQC